MPVPSAERRRTRGQLGNGMRMGGGAHDHLCLPQDRQPLGDDMRHFGAAGRGAGCRRADSQIETLQRAAWPWLSAYFSNNLST